MTLLEQDSGPHDLSIIDYVEPYLAQLRLVKISQALANILAIGILLELPDGDRWHRIAKICALPAAVVDAELAISIEDRMEAEASQAPTDEAAAYIRAHWWKMYCAARAVFRNGGRRLSSELIQFARLRKPTGLPSVVRTAPEPNEVVGFFGALRSLRRSDPACYSAVTLAACAGLRRAEIIAARRGWLCDSVVPPKVGVRAEVDFIPKSYHGRAAPLLGGLRGLQLLASGTHLVPGASEATRALAVERAYAVIRAHLPTAGRRPLHYLRALYGTTICESTIGQRLQPMADALGHASIQTSFRHYYLDGYTPATLDAYLAGARRL